MTDPTLMMKLQIEHETILAYAQPVREAIGEVRLCPRSDAHQQVFEFWLTLDPPVPLHTITDRFDNIIHCYRVLPGDHGPGSGTALTAHGLRGAVEHPCAD